MVRRRQLVGRGLQPARPRPRPGRPARWWRCRAPGRGSAPAAGPCATNWLREAAAAPMPGQRHADRHEQPGDDQQQRGDRVDGQHGQRDQRRPGDAPAPRPAASGRNSRPAPRSGRPRARRARRARLGRGGRARARTAPTNSAVRSRRRAAAPASKPSRSAHVGRAPARSSASTREAARPRARPRRPAPPERRRQQARRCTRPGRSRGDVPSRPSATIRRVRCAAPAWPAPRARPGPAVLRRRGHGASYSARARRAVAASQPEATGRMASL